MSSEVAHRRTIGSLFSGAGGIELGLERAGLGPTLWQVEIDPQCRAILGTHWPAVARHEDVRTVGAAELARPWLICGGYPCQDISNAHTNGERKALDGEKSGLWREMRRIVDELRPEWVLVENVDAPERWLSRVRGDLWGLGYASLPVRVCPSWMGAPHERPRVFVLAHADRQGQRARAVYEALAGVREVAGARGHWGASPPGGYRVDDGVSAGMDRVRICGNAVSPFAAQAIGQALRVAA